jgi:O-methyltransferase domain/Dimerisation domain
MLPPLPEHDPTQLYRYRDALYATDLLIAALVHLDFFSYLDANPCDAETLRDSLNLAERPTDVMLTLFVAMGLLSRDGAVYRLTGSAREHLVRSSPWFLGPYYASFKERPVCKDFVEIFRTGRPANFASAPAQADWARAMENPEFARQFTAAMDCRGLYLGRAVARAVDLRQHHQVLDIAGGSGIYSCCLVEHYSNLRATVLERPPVDTVTARAIGERGFSDRISIHSADMFTEPLPDSCDVHLFSNVLHDWDIPVVRQLLEASASALPTGGLVLIHDAHLNEDKSGPLPVAAYSTLLMHACEGRCYGISEMRELLHDSGLKDVRFVPTLADRSVIVATKGR